MLSQRPVPTHKSRWRLTATAFLLAGMLLISFLRSQYNGSASAIDAENRHNAGGRNLLQDDMPMPMPDEDCEPEDFAGDKCLFVRTVEDCQPDDNYINYFTFYYCNMNGNGLGWLGIIVLILVVLITIRFLALTAEEFLAPLMGKIADTLHMSHNMAGVTFLAFANSAPDFFASYVALTSGSEALGVGDLLGNAVFSPSLATAIIGYICHGTIITAFSLTRDIVWFLGGTIFLFYLVLQHQIRTYQSILLICIYVSYVFFVFISQYMFGDSKKIVDLDLDDFEPRKPTNVEPNKLELPPTKKEADQPKDKRALSSVSYHNFNQAPLLKKTYEAGHRSKSWVENSTSQDGPVMKQYRKRTQSIAKQLEEDSESGFLYYVMKFADLTGIPMFIAAKLTIPSLDDEDFDYRLIMFNWLAAPVFIIWQFGGDDPGGDRFGLVWTAIAGLGTAVAFYLYGRFVLKNLEKPFCVVPLIIFGIVGAVAWLDLIAGELVGALTVLGTILDIPEAILGLTILCWGNNISDLIGVVSVAKLGYPDMGLGATWSSPLLDTTLTMGFGFLLNNLSLGSPTFYPYDFSLLISTIWMFTVGCSFLAFSLFNKFKLHRYFSMALITLYVAYIVAVIAGPHDVTEPPMMEP